MMTNSFILFLLGSYAMGWAISALHAKLAGFLDLCQFIRHFMIAPIALLGILLFGFAGYQWVAKSLIPQGQRALMGKFGGV